MAIAGRLGERHARHGDDLHRAVSGRDLVRHCLSLAFHCLYLVFHCLFAAVRSNNSRASIITDLPTARLSAAGLEPAGALLDLREATYSRRYTGQRGACSYSVQQRWYAHRATPSLFVMEIGVDVPCGCKWEENITLLVSPDVSPKARTVSTSVNLTHSSTGPGGGTITSTGTTAEKEGDRPLVQLAVIAARLPTVIVVPAATACGNTTHRFVVAVRSSLSSGAPLPLPPFRPPPHPPPPPRPPQAGFHHRYQDSPVSSAGGLQPGDEAGRRRPAHGARG